MGNDAIYGRVTKFRNMLKPLKQYVPFMEFICRVEGKDQTKIKLVESVMGILDHDHTTFCSLIESQFVSAYRDTENVLTFMRRVRTILYEKTTFIPRDYRLSSREYTIYNHTYTLSFEHTLRRSRDEYESLSNYGDKLDQNELLMCKNIMISYDMS